MSPMGFGRMAELRADYANALAAYKMGDFASTHVALESAVVYIEELERWVGSQPGGGTEEAAG